MIASPDLDHALVAMTRHELIKAFHSCLMQKSFQFSSLMQGLNIVRSANGIALSNATTNVDLVRAAHAE